MNEIAVNHAGHLAKSAESKLKEYARDFLIVPVNLTPIAFTTIETSGILQTVHNVCRSRHRRESTRKIWEDVLDRFAECDDIDFDYPTSRSYSNVIEGKRGTMVTLPKSTHELNTESTNV